MRHATPTVQLTLRISPQLYEAIQHATIWSNTAKSSLNQWCIQAIERAVKEQG